MNMRLRPFTMFDSVTVPEIPANAEAVAGYVDGKYRTYPELVVKFPHADKLSIAVESSSKARCLDVEPGDATNAQAAAWVKQQHAIGARRPILYSSVSNWPALQAALKKAGVGRGLPGLRKYRRWTAHYTGHPHRCSRKCWPGFTGRAAATQYTDKADGRNLDASLCSRDFLR
jgi:hypothetical protein